MCTSGTAVANFHGAALEAVHAGLGLVLISADRPARFRDTGANQTTDQVGIFGEMVRTIDLTDGEDFPVDFFGRPRPVHLNLQFDEPLLPDAPWHLPEPPTPADTGRATALPVSLELGPRTVVVAGDDAGPPARVLAQEAELAFASRADVRLSHGRQRDPDLSAPAVWRVGGSDRARRRSRSSDPVTGSVTNLLGRTNVDVISLTARGVWAKRPFAVNGEFDRLTAKADDPAWLDAWRAADRDVSRRLDQLLSSEPGLTPQEVAGAVSAAVPPGGMLYVGASNPDSRPRP